MTLHQNISGNYPSLTMTTRPQQSSQARTTLEFPPHNRPPKSASNLIILLQLWDKGLHNRLRDPSQILRRRFPAYSPTGDLGRSPAGRSVNRPPRIRRHGARHFLFSSSGRTGSARPKFTICRVSLSFLAHRPAEPSTPFTVESVEVTWESIVTADSQAFYDEPDVSTFITLSQDIISQAEQEVAASTCLKYQSPLDELVGKCAQTITDSVQSSGAASIVRATTRIATVTTNSVLESYSHSSKLYPEHHQLQSRQLLALSTCRRKILRRCRRW